MNKVCEKLNLLERDFFGLTYFQARVKVMSMLVAF